MEDQKASNGPHSNLKLFYIFEDLYKSTIIGTYKYKWNSFPAIYKNI